MRADQREVGAVVAPPVSRVAQAERLERQLAAVESPDNRRRLLFIAPSLAAERERRDAFFAALARPENRETESWVLDALANLHHPDRRAQSLAYLPATLDVLEEIQVTGDIFFPARWLVTSFSAQPAHAASASFTLATTPSKPSGKT